MTGKRARTTKGEREGAGAVMDLAAGIALGPLGAAGSKLIRALANSVEERLAAEKAERRERFLRALLTSGAFASAESSEFKDLKLTEIYQLILLDDEEEKADLGAKLIAAFKTGKCQTVQRPILVRMLRELPMGALHLLSEISASWDRACREVQGDPDVADNPRHAFYRDLVRDLAWSMTPDNRREGDMLLSSYRLMLLHAGALQPARQDSQPVDVPPPSSVGHMLVSLCGLVAPIPDWRPIQEAIALGIPRGLVEARRRTKAGVETLIGTCSRRQTQNGFEPVLNPINQELRGSKYSRRARESLLDFEEIREIRLPKREST